MTTTNLSPQQLEKLQHTLGYDRYGQRKVDRNFFVTARESEYGEVCESLVAMGLMTRSPGNELTGGDELYRATDAGRKAMLDQSPSPPKRTRSQLRYEEFLRADSGLTFMEWLKADAKRKASGVL